MNGQDYTDTDGGAIWVATFHGRHRSEGFSVVGQKWALVDGVADYANTLTCSAWIVFDATGGPLAYLDISAGTWTHVDLARARVAVLRLYRGEVKQP